MSRGKLLGVLAVLAVVAFAGGWLWGGRTQSPPTAAAAAGAKVVMYQNPACGCCGKWARHMREAGFEVEVHKTAELNAIKAREGIDAKIAACHTAYVNGYIVEGHVPAQDVKRLLAERPDVRGITVPGMPSGSPGMEGAYSEPYEVLTFDAAGNTTVFAQH